MLKDIKEGKEDKFREAFLKDFGDDFYLLSKKEVLECNLFGEYTEEILSIVKNKVNTRFEVSPL